MNFLFLVDMYVNSAEDENQDNLMSFDDLPNGLPSKHDIISSLAVGGSWVTSQTDLQVYLQVQHIQYIQDRSCILLATVYCLKIFCHHSWCCL